MGRIYLEKFPVVSTNGTQYRVTIFQDNFGVYSELHTKKRSWFGRDRFKKVSGGIYAGRYNLANWNYDFVAIAHHTVKRYEDTISAHHKAERRKQEGIAKFKEWDGVMND